MEKIERLSRKIVYEGAIVDFCQDTVRLPNQKTEIWDLVHHRKGAAAILPVLPDGRILMIHQYRPALDRETLEIPAGARDSIDEETIICATRELTEETGYAAEKIELLFKLRPTVAYCDEFIDVFLATGLKRVGDQQLDEAESIDIEAFELDELIQKVYSGEIQDGKTVGAIMAYKVKCMNILIKD